MTILSSTSRATYTGNGSVSNYSYSFKIFNEDDLLITVRHPTTGDETTLTLTTDYTVTILANGTGSIDLVNASQAWLTAGKLTTSWVIVIRRVVELIQDTDIRNQGSFYPETHENAFDHLMMATQQLKDEIDRSLKIAETDNTLTLRLPTSTERASQFLGFNASGEPIAAGSVTGVPVSAFMQTVLDDADAAAARSTLGLGSISTVNTITTSEITDNTIANGDLRQSAGLSVIGRSANSTGNVADITAANDYEVIQRVGTAIGFGPYKLKVRSVTTTDSPTTADDILNLSGASFTITLPTAVGNTGKEFTFLHEGTSLTQVYTFNTTSSQTIGGIASGVYKLYTNGEKLKIVSDGANWKITNHVAMTATVTTTLTITGTTSNPTKGTMTTDEIAWYRNGAFAFFHLKYIATTAGAAGSGNYLFLLPNSLTIDTTLTGADTGTSSLSNGLAVVNGTLFGQANTGSVSALYPQVHDSTHVKFGGLIGGALNYWGSGGVALSNANVQMNGWFSVPISGWQP